MKQQKPTAAQEASWAAYEKSLLAMLPVSEARQLLKHNRPIFERRCGELQQTRNRLGSIPFHDFDF
jgi:hypothetical protein